MLLLNVIIFRRARPQLSMLLSKREINGSDDEKE
jgi:hypothetical protein